jgi:hypothetical protein
VAIPGIKGSVLDLRQRDSIRDHRLAKRLILVRNDMRGVEKQKLEKTRSAQRPL